MESIYIVHPHFDVISPSVIVNNSCKYEIIPHNIQAIKVKYTTKQTSFTPYKIW